MYVFKLNKTLNKYLNTIPNCNRDESIVFGKSGIINKGTNLSRTNFKKLMIIDNNFDLEEFDVSINTIGVF